MSAKVHMDEKTPHMHLIFLPVVHTKDKKGNDIEKQLVVNFGKLKIVIDNYKILFNYMTSYNFELERGVPKEE